LRTLKLTENIYITVFCYLLDALKKGNIQHRWYETLYFSILVDNLRKYVSYKSIRQLSYKDILNINYVVLMWHLVYHYILYKYKFVFDATWNQHGFTNLWIRHLYTKKAQTTAQSTEIFILKICKVVSIEYQLWNILIIHQCELSNLYMIVWCMIWGINDSHNS
jgi:hypothetical protein